MGFLEKLLWTGGAVLVGAAIRSSRQAAQETRRRINSPPCFDDGVTELEFAEIAVTAARSLPRLKNVHVTGMTAVIDVGSNSGLSTWLARVDFNDYGHLTGNYWLETDNTESVIPELFAKSMQTAIRTRVG